MFIEDDTNGGLFFEQPEFVEYFWKHIIPEDIEWSRELRDIPENPNEHTKLPNGGVMDLVPDLETYAVIHNPYAGSSTTWAFGSDDSSRI